MVKRIAFNVYVALNMALCSILLAPLALPRETISGLLGRYKRTSRAAAFFASGVDALYFWEKDHCAEVAKLEARAREILYP